MQDYVMVVWVGFMVVDVPVRRPDMDFYIACPFLSLNDDLRVKKIGAGLLQVLPGIDYLHGLTLYCLQIQHIELFKLPDVM